MAGPRFRSWTLALTLTRQGRRHAVKSDKLSFLRVRLSQTDAPLGSPGRYAVLRKGGRPCPVRELLFDTQQRITRQPSLLNSTSRELLKRSDVFLSFLPQCRYLAHVLPFRAYCALWRPS